MKVDLARLNHVLVPPTKSERDRYRDGRMGRRVRVLVRAFARFTREGRILLTAACVAAVFAVDLGHTESHLLVVASFSLLFTSLLFTPGYRLTGVTVDLRSPRRVTVGEELAITVSFRNDGPREHRCIRIERPLLPWDGQWSGPPPTLAKVPAGATASVVARARFVARGEHHIDPLRAAALLPLWLAQGPPLRTEGARFVVVPRVARVTSVPVGPHRRHQAGGTATAARTGEATDLLGVRPYRAGDPVRDLHARSWARHGSPMVREYQEEHLARIGVVVDSDVTGTSDEHLEGALSLAAGVIARLGRGEARVNLLVAGDEAYPLASERNVDSLDRALDVLAAVRPTEAFSAERIVGRLGGRLERLSSIVLVFLKWEAARAELAAMLRSRGVDCVVLVLGDRSSRDPHGTTVALDAIRRGEVLPL